MAEVMQPIHAPQSGTTEQTSHSPATLPMVRPRPRFLATVRNVEQPSPTLTLLELELPTGGDFAFQAGQFCMVQGQASDGPRRRAYSISSPPSWLPRLDLAVSMANQAGVSGWLCSRKPGDTIPVEHPVGRFTLRPGAQPRVFMATSTGVAPFRSMLYDQWDHGCEPEAWLFVGASSVPGLPYHEELTAHAAIHPGLHYTPVVSHPIDRWKGARGRIQAPFLVNFDGRTDFDAYLCGSPAMVQDTLDLLKRRGFPKQQVFQERFA